MVHCETGVVVDAQLVGRGTRAAAAAGRYGLALAASPARHACSVPSGIHVQQKGYYTCKLMASALAEACHLVGLSHLGQRLHLTPLRQLHQYRTVKSAAAPS